MIFSLVVYSPPTSQASHHALSFAKALLSQGHDIYRVFFYGEGVNNTNALLCPPGDETNLAEAWQHLKQSSQQNVDLVTCIAAGLKRGVVDQEEAKRNNLSSHNLLPDSELSGLGQLLDATVQSDRVLTFA